MSTVEVVINRKKKRAYAGPDWQRQVPLHRLQELIDWHLHRGWHVKITYGEVHAPYVPIGWDA